MSPSSQRIAFGWHHLTKEVIEAIEIYGFFLVDIIYLSAIIYTWDGQPARQTQEEPEIPG